MTGTPNGGAAEVTGAGTAGPGGTEPPGAWRRLANALRERLARAPRPVYLSVDGVRMLEVPVLTDLKARLGRGDARGAILEAYPRVLADVERAYGVRFDADMTHEEILGRPVDGSGHLAGFLVRFLALYEPIRYGADHAVLEEDPVDLLRSIYSLPPMWQLYVEPVYPRRSAPSRPRGTGRRDGWEGNGR